MRTIFAIAAEIKVEWTKINYAAKPYLDAMAQLETVEDWYYDDSAKSIILYFLANAQTWRGIAAIKIKKELFQIVS